MNSPRCAPNGSSSPSKTKARERFAGLVYVNGVLTSNAAFEAMNPETIQSVEVIKGAVAAALSSDPAAANGIVRITTKNGSR